MGQRQESRNTARYSTGEYMPEIGQNLSHYKMWDISPDGKRFLMVKNESAGETSAGGAPVKINIVLNWFEELKQRVPMK